MANSSDIDSLNLANTNPHHAIQTHANHADSPTHQPTAKSTVVSRLYKTPTNLHTKSPNLSPKSQTPKRLSLLGKCALFALIVIIACALILPFFTPYAPEAMDLDAILAPASSAHILGTDYLGRDIYTRLIYGARLSLCSVALILALVLALGIGIGSLAGFAGGRIDNAIMRICDIFLSMPTAILSLLFIAILGAGLANVIIAIALTHWAWYARIVRALVLSLKSKEYVLLSRVYGASATQNYKRNMLTPIFSQCLVLATMDIGHFMLHIAGLSFLGLGVQAPQAEWGVMLSEAKEYMWSNPELLLYPGLALFVCVAVCNVVGDSLRDYLDVNVYGH